MAQPTNIFTSHVNTWGTPEWKIWLETCQKIAGHRDDSVTQTTGFWPQSFRIIYNEGSFCNWFSTQSTYHCQGPKSTDSKDNSKIGFWTATLIAGFAAAVFGRNFGQYQNAKSDHALASKVSAAFGKYAPSKTEPDRMSSSFWGTHVKAHGAESFDQAQSVAVSAKVLTEHNLGRAKIYTVLSSVAISSGLALVIGAVIPAASLLVTLGKLGLALSVIAGVGTVCYSWIMVPTEITSAKMIVISNSNLLLKNPDLFPPPPYGSTSTEFTGTVPGK